MNFWGEWKDKIFLFLSLIAIVIAIIGFPEQIKISRTEVILLIGFLSLGMLLLLLTRGLDIMLSRIEMRLERIEKRLAGSPGNPHSQLSKQEEPKYPETTGKGAIGGGLIGAGVGFLAAGIPGLILGAIIGAAIGDQVEKNSKIKPPKT